MPVPAMTERVEVRAEDVVLGRELPPVRAIKIGPTEPPPANRTLGWAILKWVTKWLLQPDGPNAGKPWKYTKEQVIWLLNWYAIDEKGKFVYRRGSLRRAKGWGKDPLIATICFVEMIGPCRFGGWRANGMPRVVPQPAAWVQLAAVSQQQTKNTSNLFTGMVSQDAIDAYQVEIGIENSYALGRRARLDAVTSSPLALEGGRPTLFVINEPQNWLASNDGHKMAAVGTRNAAKVGGRVLRIGNAHVPGVNSDAEQDYEAWLKISSGKSQATGFLYDSLEAPPDVEVVPVPTGDVYLEDGTQVFNEDGSAARQLVEADMKRARASLRTGLVATYGDSYWVDVDRLIEEIYDPKTSLSDSRRFYLNQIVAAEDAYWTKQEWDSCAAPEKVVAAGEIVVLGLDGSTKDDHTVLVGCRVSDSHVFLIRAWDPSEQPGHEIPMARVDEEVAAAFAKYDVVGFYSDRWPFEVFNLKWEQAYGEQLCARASSLHPVQFDMGRGMARQAAFASQEYHDAVCERDMSHDGSTALAQYHLNARRRATVWEGVVMFGKETEFSNNKVDGVAAAVLARKARQDYLSLPESKRRQVVRQGSVFFA